MGFSPPRPPPALGVDAYADVRALTLKHATEKFHKVLCSLVANTLTRTTNKNKYVNAYD